MSNLVNYAKQELGSLPANEMIDPYKVQILKIVEIFSNEGHSGGSAPFGANAISSCIKRLLNFEPLQPITGEEDEWFECHGGGVWQNKRCYSVFKNKEGRAYFLDAIVWKTQTGSTWSGMASGISSVCDIKSFPFTPKTFTIDVIEEEVKKDDWVFHVKDKTQLEEVFNYYNQRNHYEKDDHRSV